MAKSFKDKFTSQLGLNSQTEIAPPPQQIETLLSPIKRSNTSTKGLKVGYTRMTCIVREDQQEKLKYCAFRLKTSIKDIVSEALEDYFKKYEKVRGTIDIND